MRKREGQSQPLCLGTYSTNFDDIPLVERRGFGHIDPGNLCIAVKGEVQAVSETLVEHYHANTWHNNVYAKSISVLPESVIVFRFKFHDWTLIQAAGFQPIQAFPELNYSYAEDLAKVLGTEAIFCKTADGLYQYYFYDGDRNPEGFYFDACLDQEYGYDADQQIALAKFRSLEYLEYSEELDGHFGFYSSVREIDVGSVISDSSPFQFVSNFLKERDVYIPTILWKEKQIGDSAKITICGLSGDDIDRMDYLSVPMSRSNA